MKPTLIQNTWRQHKYLFNIILRLLQLYVLKLYLKYIYAINYFSIFVAGQCMMDDGWKAEI